MKHRKAEQSKKKAPLTVIERGDEQALRAYFADHAQALLPLLESVEAQAGVEELMNAAAGSFVEQLLLISAEQIAGAKHPARTGGEIGWPGT